MEKETRILHPQIIFQLFSTTEEINIPQFSVCNVDLNLHIHHSLPVHIQQFKIFNPPQLHKDRRLQEFFVRRDTLPKLYLSRFDISAAISKLSRQIHPATDNIENPPLLSSMTTQGNIVEDNLDIEH